MKLKLFLLGQICLLGACTQTPGLFEQNPANKASTFTQSKAPELVTPPPLTPDSPENEIRIEQNTKTCNLSKEKDPEKDRYGTLRGFVYDHLGQAIPNATVTLKYERVKDIFGHIRSEREFPPCEGQYEYTRQSDKQGAFYFENVKRFSRIKLNAKKSGYVSSTIFLPERNENYVEPLPPHAFSSQQLTYFRDDIPEEYLIDYLKQEVNFGVKNKQVSPENKHAALLDLPEVRLISPGWNITPEILKSLPELTITFSEPMDSESVEKNLIFYSLEKEELSPKPQSGDKVFGIEAFDKKWSHDLSSLSLKLKPNYDFPAFGTRYYYLSFTRKDGSIRDKKGIARTQNYFYLTQVNPLNKNRFETLKNYQGGFQFGIEADEQPPEIESLRTEGTNIWLRYSEAMQITTLSQNWVASRDGNVSKAPAAYTDLKNPAFSISARDAAQNYFIALVREGKPILGPIQLSEIGGEAIFDDNDPENKSIRLSLDIRHKAFDFVAENQIWKPGDTLWVEVSESVEDPAGNSISPLHKKAKYLIP